MAQQQVNQQKLKSAGTNLGNLSEKMQKEMTKLDENIKKVQTTWDSEAATTFVKKYQTDKNNLAQLQVVMREMSKALIEFSQNYNNADAKASDLIHKYLGK